MPRLNVVPDPLPMPVLHPACAAWPQMTDAELDKLAADIREKGLLEPITLMAGSGDLLDGRNRWLACQRAGVPPRTQTYDGDDPVGYVLSRNGQWRKLSKASLALVMGKLNKLAPHRPIENNSRPEVIRGSAGTPYD